MTKGRGGVVGAPMSSRWEACRPEGCPRFEQRPSFEIPQVGKPPIGMTPSNNAHHLPDWSLKQPVRRAAPNPAFFGIWYLVICWSLGLGIFIPPSDPAQENAPGSRGP